MPAFATSLGGPLNDFQVASLADYLNSAIPSHVFSLKTEQQADNVKLIKITNRTARVEWK
jgi:hypothetical protein